MNIETPNRSAQASELLISDIRDLDLKMIKLKLQDEEEGQGWTPEQCDKVEIEYKRFLALKRNYPSREIVPNGLIDKFWHQHILDTAKYAEDCKKLFGYFLHHFPYFGMNGEDDSKNLLDAFEETKAIYKLHFNGDYADDNANAPKCRTKCKPVKCK